MEGTPEAVLREEARAALAELLAAGGFGAGHLLVIGASTSEVTGRPIGSATRLSVGEALVAGCREAAGEVELAFQCCEHLNRALVVERSTLQRRGLEQVWVRPVIAAGGGLATAAYGMLRDPVVVERIAADGGLDIGLTLIGMHLRPVAIPVRLHQGRIGEATVVAARTRPRLIGGSRAVYPPWPSAGQPSCEMGRRNPM